MNNRLINTKVAGGGGGCTDIVDNYDPFGGGGLALYQLNGNANDVSGNYNGTATNVTYGTGVFGQAGVFNGSSSKIEIGSVISSVSDTTDFSFSQWLNFSALPTSGGIMGIWGSSNTNLAAIRFAMIEISGQYRLDFLRNFNNTYYYSNSYPTVSLNNNSWYNLVLTYVASTKTVKYFLNGSQVSEFNLDQSASITVDGNLTLGAYSSNQTARTFNGSIDQVRIFNTALTPLEVEALYTEELCICDGTVDTLQVLGDTSCIATYQLDGNANDLSGNYSGEATDVSYGVGEFDLAGVFNGSSSVIVLPDNIIPTNFVTSLSVWVKGASLANSSSSADIIFQNAYGGPYFALITKSNLLELFTKNSSGTNYRAFQYSLSNFNTTDWYHICVTFSGLSNTVNLYVNGVNVDSGSLQSSSSTLTLSNTIGNEEGSTIGWNGSIDQFRIFNKALNSTEVTTLYNETACAKGACSGTTNTLDILGDGSCIAAYPLDGSPADLSGNYNGVQTNVTYPVGEFDLSANFNQSNGNIIIEGLPALSTFTLSFWIKQPNPSGNNFAIMHFYDFAGGAGVNNNFIYGGDKLSFFPYNAASDNAMQLNSTTTANEVFNGNWNHIVLTTQGTFTTTKLYINSNLRALDDFSLTDSSIRMTNYLSIGIRGDGYQYPNKRLNELDQVRIFNKALNSTEVGILFNDETPCN